MLHADWSKFWAAAEIDTTYIYAGKYKTEGNPDEPLSEEAREHFQEIVDDMYTQFVNERRQGPRRPRLRGTKRLRAGPRRVRTASPSSSASPTASTPAKARSHDSPRGT